MNGELEEIWKDNDAVCFKAPFWMDWGNPQTTLMALSGITAEIRTGDISNTKQYN